MKRRSSFPSTILLPLLAAGTHAGAQILLLDPHSSDAEGVSTSLTGSAPYTVPAGSRWNQGDETYSSSLLYADGSTATGITVLTDGISLTSGNGTIDFANAPDVATIGSDLPAGTIFGEAPAESANFVGGSSTAEGFLGMRITSLPFGTYDIYVVAAYVGSSTSDRPGGNTPAPQDVWVFSGATADTLSFGSGTVTGGGTAQRLLNDINTSWTEDRNFERRQVTVDSTNPTLYIATAGVNGNSSSEERPWLNLVQIVAVPEPSTALLLLGGALGLCARRRSAPRP